MTQPADEATVSLDVNELLTGLGEVHAELAAHGAVPLMAELAQLRVLVRQQKKQIEALRGQIPPSATATATP